MKGKISKSGVLQIWRKRSERSGFSASACVFDHEVSCSDLCSHFGEPQEDTVLFQYEGGKEQKEIVCKLTLCHRSLIFTEFIDER